MGIVDEKWNGKDEMKKEGKKRRERKEKRERRKGTERRFFSKQGGKGRTEKESSEPDGLLSSFVTHAHALVAPTHALDGCTRKRDIVKKSPSV